MRWYALILCLILFGGLFYILAPKVSGDDVNLGLIPAAWSSENNGQQFALGSSTNIVLDTNALYNGNPSIRLDPHTDNDANLLRECDGPSISVTPGDHIVFSVWIKTTASTIGDTSAQSGGRIGIDFYGSLGGIRPILTPDGSLTANDQDNTYVHWGTFTWSKMTMDFYVAPVYNYVYSSTGSTGQYPDGSLVTPTSIIPWMQAWSGIYGATDNGTVWFSNSELYINPSMPTPSPSPTATPTPTLTLTPPPLPTDTVSPNPTPAYAQTPLPSPSPSATLTPIPTSTPILTPAPSPSSTPRPSSISTPLLASEPPLTVSVDGGTTILTGQAWAFSVKVLGGLRPYSYQWYEGNTPLPGQTLPELTITKDVAGTYSYFCRVVDSGKTSATSNTVTMTVISLQESPIPVPTYSPIGSPITPVPLLTPTQSQDPPASQNLANGFYIILAPAILAGIVVTLAALAFALRKRRI